MMAAVPLVETLLPCARHVKWVSLAWLRKFVHVRRTSSIAASASNVTEKAPMQKPGKNARTEGLSGTSSREDVRAIRIKKIEEMKGQAYEPYAGSWKRTHKAIDLQEKYMHLGNGLEANGDEDHVSVAGRIVARRVFGKLAFLTLRDDSASIQLYCEKTKMEEAKFDQLKTLMDIGDFVGAVGTIKRTEKGELSVCTTEVVILTKSLLPLPDKWHGLTDIEKRYRQRYLDMIMNPDVAKVFQARAKAITEIRKHLEGLSYMEIETPILQGAAGGADARPFITYHNALGQDMFLRIATELHLKRMVVGGLERVYEIGRIFRNEGLSPRHNPEFTSVEIYEAYADYTDMMVMAEELVTKCALAIHGRLNINYQGTEIIFKRPWRRATMHALVHEVTGIDFTNFETESDLEAAKSAAFSALSDQDQHVKLFISSCTSVGQLLNEVFEAVVEKTLIQPTFVTHYPVEVSPLAKRHRSLPGLAERFELFIFGRELANAFSELTDPIEQRVRLEAQIQVHNERMSAARENAKEQGGAALKEHANEAYEVKLDDDFLTALEYGMPPTAGMGIGIDRLVMLLTDSASIRDVIAFPMLKAVPTSESS